MSNGPEIGQAHLFEPPPAETLTLAEKFLVPPFTVLDARAGYWRERKQAWANLGIEPELGNRAESLLAEELGMQSGEGRGANLLSSGTVREGYGGRGDRAGAVVYYMEQGKTREEAEALYLEAEKAAGRQYDLSKGENAWGGAGTSLFDPVLTELAYRWFSPKGGRVLDPFAGGSVRGIVAAYMEREYTGIDLRAEQVHANRAQADRLVGEHLPRPTWVEGDSRHAAKLAGGGEGYDFIFSCPPYYDLEVYSDNPADLSTAPTYEEFAAGYYECIHAACQLLKPDRFAAFVVGELRGKDGHYLGLVPNTTQYFQLAGLELWNEAILVTAVGSLPIRTSRTFGPARKLGKAHQNLLVYCKGNGKLAAEACGPLLEIALEQGGATFKADGTVEAGGEVQPAFKGEEPGA